MTDSNNSGTDMLSTEDINDNQTENCDSNASENANSEDLALEAKKLSWEKSSLCLVWLDNPVQPGWSVRLSLYCESPEDPKERIGFAVTSQSFRQVDNSGSGNRTDYVARKNFKTHSKHEYIDERMFRHILTKGLFFTKLEFHGSFFNEVSICPGYATPAKAADLELITLPNVKTLIIRVEAIAAVKGPDAKLQDMYFNYHVDHFRELKPRIAKNLWYMIQTLYCPKLELMDIQDLVEWDEEIEEDGFCYWNQPMIDFMQRHSATLKTFWAIPLTIMEKTRHLFREGSRFPLLEEMIFWPKFPTSARAHPDGSEKTACSFQHVDQSLDVWRKYLREQRDLKSLGWICDARNPWQWMRREFVSICQENSKMETLMLTLHGDEALQKLFPDEGTPPPSNWNDYNVDGAIIHPLTRLKVLFIKCDKTDDVSKRFRLFNLQLLPQTLTSLYISGIRISREEIKNLAYLPHLSSLSLIQTSNSDLIAIDEINSTPDGVTGSVLSTLLRARNLNQLVIIGFSFANEKEAGDGEEDIFIKRPSGVISKLTAFFAGLCNASKSSNVIGKEEISKNDAPTPAESDKEDDVIKTALQHYPSKLQRILYASRVIGQIDTCNEFGGVPAISLQIGKTLTPEDNLNLNSYQ